jgi:hypothetical protein
MVIRSIIFALFLGFIIFTIPSFVLTCDVAVISANTAKNGRPIIWKNRDDPAGFFIGVRKHTAKNPKVGTYVCIEERLYPDALTICSAGVNEAGFAIANTDAYTGSTPKELLSIDSPLLERALSNCTDVECFENMLIEAHNHPAKFYVTSSNFVVIDAHGGAIHYEAYADLRQPVDFIKHDANIEHFSNKTNYIALHEIYDSTSEARAHRATDLLTYYYNQNELTPKIVMQEISKDVCDNDTSQDLENFNTRYCISRAYTRLGVVIEGVAPGEDPKFATMWVNLGEPSVGVFVPVYPAAKYIPLEVKENLLGSAPFNTVIPDKELEFYSNNGSVNKALEFPGLKDMTMNKRKLLQWQPTPFFIEDNLFNADAKVKVYINNIKDPSQVEEILKTFSKDAAKYAYETYTGENKTPNKSNLKSFEIWLKSAYRNANSLILRILGQPI